MKCDAWMRLDLPRSRSVSSAQLLMLSLVTQSIKSNAYQATFPPLAIDKMLCGGIIPHSAWLRLSSVKVTSDFSLINFFSICRHF